MAQRVLYRREDGKWAWRLVANNGRVIATDGSQGYNNESEARDMADRIIRGDFKNAEKRIIHPKSPYGDLAKLVAEQLSKY
jgi:uncharacterized protein YegP (UPF0339 family)